MRILLFDWLVAGHHENHVRRYAAALADHEIVVAVPDPLADRIGDLPVEVVPLGEPLPVVDTSRYLSLAARRAAERELFRHALARTRPDRAVALYGDGLVRPLAAAPPVAAPTTLSVFRPRAHYPEVYGAAQRPRERLAARAFDRALARWRLRPDAHSVLTLDEGAAAVWSTRPGAPAHALPEPLLPVERPRPPSGRDAGCLVFGALAPRKGIELLARAVASGTSPLRVTLAGAVEPGYEPALDRLVATMRSAGAEVEVVGRWVADAEAVDLIAAARCVVVPYQRHDGMSGVLAEAAAVGTPAVVHDWGLLAHVVRHHGLGRAVDCGDPAALRGALVELSADGAREAFGPRLREYAERHAPERFRAVVRAAVAS
jgi:glycosyltransferase involved in cell wall biosynthesis